MIKETIDKITALRMRCGLSARKLSLSLNKSDNYITLLENRRSFLPPLETLFEIIYLCESTPQEFFADPNIVAFYSDKDMVEFLNGNKELLNLWKDASPEKKAAAISVLKLDIR